jgi:predicted transcriptional regulator
MPAHKVSDSSDRISVTIGATARAALEHMAERKERSLAWVVREAIRQYLDKYSESDAAK